MIMREETPEPYEQKLKDAFAVAALIGLLSGAQGTTPVDTSDPMLVAKAAWEYAKQMMAHREG